MSGEQILFLVIATITILASLGMVSVVSVFHAALLMVLAFIGIGGLYMTMGAGFLGVIQILIYVGAIAVLMIFAIMLTPRVMSGAQTRFNPQWWVAALLAVGFVILIVQQVSTTPWPVTSEPLVARDYAVEIGNLFVSPATNGYLLPFEVASFLLLVALVGAIAIAREEK